MIECPNFFEVSPGFWLLVESSKSTVLARIGIFERKTHTFTPLTDRIRLDFGWSVYAT